MCHVICGARGHTSSEFGAQGYGSYQSLFSLPSKKFAIARKEELSKLEMIEQLWDDRVANSSADHSYRSIPEYYSRVLTPSQTERLPVTLLALSNRRRNTIAKANIAYTLVGLLHQGIPMYKQHGELQPLVHLSLASDSDGLIERMACTFTRSCQQHQSLFLSMV